MFSLFFIASEKASADGLLDYSVRSQFDSSVVLKARTKYTAWWGTVTNSAATDIIEGKSEVATTRTRIRVLDSVGTVCKDSGWSSPTSFNPEVVRSEVYWFNFFYRDLTDAGVGPFYVESYHSYKSKKTNQWYTFKVNHKEALNGKMVDWVYLEQNGGFFLDND
ncbi:hypothetical protein ACWOCD_18290 [Enterococcus silesiacus]